MEAQFHHFLAGAPPDDDQESDCESALSSSSSPYPSFQSRRVLFPDSLAVELSEAEGLHEVIRRRFLSSLGPVGERTTVVAIHRKNWSGFCHQARLQSFQIHSRAVADQHGGSSNVRFGWFGNGRERIEEILSRGFSYREIQDNINGAIFLSPDYSPAESVERAVPDEDGVRHVLLCRVILGRSELVPPGSEQTQPSSEEFDSGVDRVEYPKKYVIWSTDMNTRILPEYVVSFSTPDSSSSLIRGCSRTLMEGGEMKIPTSPWISFPSLIQVLSKFLPQGALALIINSLKEFREKRITRVELIRRVRKVAGDKLLIAVIKSCRRSKEMRKTN